MKIDKEEAIAIVRQIREMDMEMNPTLDQVDLTSPRATYNDTREFIKEERKKYPKMNFPDGREYWRVEFPYWTKHPVRPDVWAYLVDCETGEALRAL